MPFWRDLDDPRDPNEVLLAQTGPNRFALRRGFLYKAPDEEDAYPVPPGASSTDLASVPWPLWWLVASYGRHTKAVLLHDVLIDPDADLVRQGVPVVPRRKADRLLFLALKESGFGAPEKRQRPSWMRRWFIWSAVALFGTMRKEARVALIGFLAHLVLFWALVGYAVVDGWSPFALVAAVVVGAGGFAWAFVRCIDTRLGLGLWPCAVVATVVVAPAALLAFAGALVVAFLDLLHNIAVAVRRRDGGAIVPPITPYRERGDF